MGQEAKCIQKALRFYSQGLSLSRERNVLTFLDGKIFLGMILLHRLRTELSNSWILPTKISPHRRRREMSDPEGLKFISTFL